MHPRSMSSWFKRRRIRKTASEEYWRLMDAPLIHCADRITYEEAARSLEPWLDSLCESADTLLDSLPVLPYQASHYLQQICNNACVFSYGVSSEMRAIVSLAKEYVVVEDNEKLVRHANQIINSTGKRKLSCNVIHIESNNSTTAQTLLTSEDPLSYRSNNTQNKNKYFYNYAHSIDNYPDNYFDVILIAGQAKNSCFIHAVSKLKVGGYIVIDDEYTNVNNKCLYDEMASELGYITRRYLGVRPRKYIVSETVFFRKHRVRYGLNNLDTELERYINYNNGFFIEAGGNNGVRQSNTLYLEGQRGWRGMLVEPIPELAQSCRIYRPNAIVEQVALTSFEHDSGQVKIHYAGLMSVVSGGMTSQEEIEHHVNVGCRLQNIQTYEINVSTATLSNLLDKNKISKVDFLSLDVEGFELTVLKGINFERHAPSFILVEVRHQGIKDFLESKNYTQIAQLSHHDFLFKFKIH